MKHKLETIFLFSMIFTPYVYAMYLVFTRHGI